MIEPTEDAKRTALNIMTPQWDTAITEEELQSLTDDDLAWWKEEIGLSREDLFRLFARAKEIAQELQSNEELLLGLTYNTNGGWYIDFICSDDDGRWKIHAYKEDGSALIQDAVSRPEPEPAPETGNDDAPYRAMTYPEIVAKGDDLVDELSRLTVRVLSDHIEKRHDFARDIGLHHLVRFELTV
jgi:hypothetical protein